MKNKITLIIIAMDEEMKYFLEGIKDLDVSKSIFDTTDIYSFNKDNKEYRIVKGKIGKVATAFFIGRISEVYDIERIINIGTSGGINKAVNIGDVIIADEVMYHDVDVRVFNYEYGQVPGFPKTFKCDTAFINKDIHFNDFKIWYGLVSSSDTFLSIETAKKFPLDSIKPLAGEMESAAVGQCAYLLNIPFIIIRSISDKIYKDENYKEMDNNIEIACKNCAKVLLALI